MRDQLCTVSAAAAVLLGCSVWPVSAQSMPDQIVALKAQISDLQNQIGSLQAGLMALNHNSVLALNGVLSYDAGTKTAIFTGANVFIVNGQGTTASANGLGNLIVGYNGPPNPYPSLTPPFCTDGAYPDQASCLSAGQVWGNTQKLLGSHNVIIGDGHSYTSFGGLAVGNTNIINRSYASVSGGQFNIASGIYSSVSGGQLNIASGPLAASAAGIRTSPAGLLASLAAEIRISPAGTTAASAAGGSTPLAGVSAVSAVGIRTPPSATSAASAAGRETLPARVRASAVGHQTTRAEPIAV